MKMRIYIPFNELQRAAKQSELAMETPLIENVDSDIPVIPPGLELIEDDDGEVDLYVCLDDYYVRLIVDIWPN